ncbi:transcriptional regulator [Hyphomonas neptunium ATCC 15444]|uniref:Transcriptional regulator n=3 Tax=Hyphomonas TaxID=85 RepID=Q0C0I4_HYPNA|nr:transcriptional regulator [Hyphomonas neptunium ATCC 15444]
MQAGSATATRSSTEIQLEWKNNRRRDEKDRPILYEPYRLYLDKRRIARIVAAITGCMGWTMTDPEDLDALDMTVEIVSSYVANNAIQSDQLPALIKSVHATLSDLTNTVPVPAEKLEPAVAINKSVTPEFLICLEDGAKLKMLKRYLRTRFDMTPEDYRAKWGLPADYPMVAPNYAKLRSKHAKQIGLGKKR